MYKKLLIMLICVLCLTLTLSVLPIHGESAIYESVLRLHVIANSDSEADQELKLSVRDAVLSESSALFENCKSKAEAEKAVRENISFIRSVAERSVRDAGYDYPVSVEVGVEEYPTKNYESFCFPSGKYLSLRIMIGEASGQNWWCVLYPPLCIQSASESEEAFVQAGLTGEQYNIITQTSKPRYKIKFKILEVFG